MNETVWAQIDQEKENLLPTPPVGETVVWYMGGDPNHAIPARVTAIEEPGRVAIKVFPINAFPRDQKGVYHVSWTKTQRPNTPQARNCGTWDYVRGNIPEEDYEYHSEKIKIRVSQLRAAEERAAKLEADFKAKASAQQQPKKKPIAEPLPAPF